MTWAALLGLALLVCFLAPGIPLGCFLVARFAWWWCVDTALDAWHAHGPRWSR